MGDATLTADSITYDLSQERRFAIITTLTGIFVGGAVALASGGSLVQQLAVIALITAAVSGGLYRLLCRLSAAVTEGTGHYRVWYPMPENAERTENGGEVTGGK